MYQVLKSHTLHTHPVFSDENVPCYVEDEGVKVAGVECQGVVIVKAVDFYVSQAHLIVGKNGVRVDWVGGNDWDQIWKERHTWGYYAVSYI